MTKRMMLGIVMMALVGGVAGAQEWIPAAEDNSTPDGAWRAAQGTRLCRVDNGSAVVPGQLKGDGSGCQIIFTGTLENVDDPAGYVVLGNVPDESVMEWRTADSNTVEGAFRAGTGANGRPLYVCLVKRDGGQYRQVAKIVVANNEALGCTLRSDAEGEFHRITYDGTAPGYDPGFDILLGPEIE